MSKVVSLEFEVFGKVQGVFFRKYTEKQSKQLGLRGWCMNTPNGTVAGELQGEKSKIEQMKNWLQTQGSPQSRIERAVFNKEAEINDYTFHDFSIRR